MPRRTLFQFTLLTSVLCFSLMAADVAGKWTAQVPGRDGQTREQAMTFAVDGAKLTGKVAMGPGGDADIQDGKVDGDNISFKVVREFNGNTITWNFTGVVSGDEIKFKREGGRGAAQEFTAKRVK